jgi:CRP-like cAMP-binding protein
MNMSNLLTAFTDCIHQAQKERGVVALYLRDSKTSNANDLDQQFAYTDAKIGNLLSIFPIDCNKQSENLLRALHALPSRRKHIIARMTSPDCAIDNYTQELVTPALERATMVAVTDPNNDPAKTSAFINFMQWKERIGLERAEGTHLTLTENLNSAHFLLRLKHLIEEQQTFERMFIGLANREQRQRYAELTNSHPIFATIDTINTAITTGKTEVFSTYSPRDWFTIFTAKIDLLHEFENFMATHLQAADIDTAPIAALRLEPTIESHFDFIRTLPLFVGVNRETLHSLLGQARIVQHDKGHIFLMQGEPMPRLYIVLQGWVKLFKNTVDGQEAVLQILGQGETLLETAFANNTVCPASVQAIDKVKLLSIPSVIFREHLEEDRTLAINMLATTATQSQNHINQIEQLTLRTAAQRVGWFLLRLRLMLDQQQSLEITLPFDKALIASFLDIKPETFSRILQLFRDKGFDINRQTLTLPDHYALCEFCNYDLARKCHRAGAEGCVNSEFTGKIHT